MEAKIERYDIITVQSRETDKYDNLIVNGNLKVGKKRAHLFEVFQVGAQVKIGYASYLNQEYIAFAEQTGGHIVPQPISNAPEPKSTPIKTEGKPAIPSGQEQGMWWKELGEMIRSEDVDVKTAFGKALRLAYYAKMFIVLDLNPPKE